MRKYETVFILDPDLQEKTRLEFLEKIKNIIQKENGFLVDFDEWGNKKLAYEIKKKFRGYYVIICYGGTGELVKELERNLRLNDSIIRFMTILVSDEVTKDELEKESQELQKIKQEQSKELKNEAEELDNKRTFEKSDKKNKKGENDV